MKEEVAGNVTNSDELRSNERPTVSILVVGYNSADLIEACISSIPAACNNFSYEVLFVDQGDGTTETLVAKRFPEITIVASRGNLGFAGGNNLLADHASGRCLLLLNPDVELEPGSIDELLEGSKRHADASAWGGVTVDDHGKPDIGNTVHVPSLGEMTSRIFGRSSAGLNEDRTYDADEPADALSGGFVLIRRTAWDEADGLDERYFLYCEEVDFFYRLSLCGHHFWRIGNARAHHKIGHGEIASPTRSLYRAAGVMQFARLHWSRPKQFAAFTMIWVAALQRYFAGKVLSIFGRNSENLIAGNIAVALKPGYWRYGYNPQKGLLAKIGKLSW